MSNIQKQVYVTLEDIKNGKRECSDSCPIALALERTFKDHGAESIQVDENEAVVYFDDGSFARYWNEETGQFVSDFDSGNPVKPFSFTFDADFEYPYTEDEEFDLEDNNSI